MLHTAPSILCVTDRTLCPEHFLSQISRIAAAGPAGVILREKDLCESAYRSLAAQVLSLCRQHQVPCILHTFPSAARALGATALHLPLPLLRAMPKEERCLLLPGYLLPFHCGGLGGPGTGGHLSSGRTYF